MPTRQRPVTTTRSEHWLRLVINEQQDLLDLELKGAFGWDSDPVHWISPLAKDSYKEYYDESFVEALQLPPLRVPLQGFWPKSGPRWDGLGKTRGGKVLLVEAKAYVEEAAGGGTKAGPASKRVILAALERTKKYLKVKPDAIWGGAFYQYANRIAHLYWLSVLNRIDAYLVFIYFVNAGDVPSPCTRAEWNGAIRLTKAALGLQQHRLASRIADVFIDTATLNR